MPAHARARRRWRRRPASVPVPGSGSGQGKGSLPGPILFEPGLSGMGYADPTRSAIRILLNRPAQRLSANRRGRLGGCCG